jgi:hypothetical protein
MVGRCPRRLYYIRIVGELKRTEPGSDKPCAQEGVQRPQSGGLRGLRRRLLGW